MRLAGKHATVEDPNHSVLMAWIRDHLDYPHDYCLIWPFGRTRQGYGSMGIDGEAVYVHRFVCEQKNGTPPTPEHQAAHSCNRGHDACVNWRHLSWKTPTGNQLDRLDGPGRPQRKLTPDQVDEIRALKGREHTYETAQRFGIGETNVRRVQAGQIWRNERADIRIFSSPEVLAIRGSTKSLSELAQEFSASTSQIQRIRCGKTYKHVTPNEGFAL